ncbi:restriction endonuclease [Arthrobacter humicola]|nr:restriction endonuclease [Arthrobacter humicola]MCI9872787.1 restriction endonuclease [Arthrobacter humicola]
MTVCSPRQAEFLAKAWMQYLGATGCKVSQATRDGGIDVDSEHFVGEVKHHAEPVSPGIVRQIVGVASIEGKIPLVFSLSGYSEAALDVGRRAGAALFTYSFEQGTLSALSPQGERALKLGLLSLIV